MTKVMSLRLDDELAAWVDRYAKERGVNRTQVLEGAVLSLQEGAKAGVPDLPQAKTSSPKRAAKAMPEEQSYARRCRGAVHRWDVAAADGRAIPGESRCLDCGWVKRGREQQGAQDEPSGDFSQAAADRALLFARMRQPESVKRWGK